MRNQKVSIVIPTYNEKENILKLVPEIQKIFKRLANYQPEVVIVDDDSPDRTGHELKKKFKSHSVRVFIRKKEKGLASAIKLGIEKSRGEIIIGMDADFNHDPKIIPDLLKKLKIAKIVVASRFIKQGGMDDKFRYFGTKIFNLILRLFLGFPSTDNASGFYTIRKRNLVTLGLEKIYYGYGEYHLRLVYLAKQAGFKISEVPVYYKARLYGQSKSRLLEMAKDYLKEAILLRLG